MEPLFFVYVLYSASKERYYIGQIQNLEERLIQHNTGYFKNSNTHGANDWKIVHNIPYQPRKQAMNVESHIKRAKKRKYLEDLVKYPEISQRLVVKYTDPNQ